MTENGTDNIVGDVDRTIVRSNAPTDRDRRWRRMAERRTDRTRHHVRPRPTRSVAGIAGGGADARAHGDRFAQLGGDDRRPEGALPGDRPRPSRPRAGDPQRRRLHARGLRRRRGSAHGRTRCAEGDLRRVLDGWPDRPAGLAPPPRTGCRSRVVRHRGRLHHDPRALALSSRHSRKFDEWPT